MNLSFKTPSPIPNLENGKHYAVLSNGYISALFELIDGILPK